MLSCPECSERLLDYLYGLLDEAEAQSLREHLGSCAACQQALAQAKLQQNLLAQAARKYADVPMFQVPADEAVTANPAVLPMQPPAIFPMPTRRRTSWKRWVPAAAAAALLLAVGTGYAAYHGGLDQRRQALADVRKQVETIDSKLVSLRRDTEAEASSVASRVQGQFLHVNVLGPASYQPSGVNSYRLTTQTPAGELTPAKVNVTVLAKDGDADKVLFKEAFASKGELRFVLPPSLSATTAAKPRLLIEAGSGAAKEIIEQTLSVWEPSYLTHIAMNKSVFHSGDTIFFRTLTLDRFAMTPPKQPLMLRCILYQATGPTLVPVKELQCVTQDGGIAGGEFFLPANAAYGPYQLTVTAADPATSVKPVTRHLAVEPGGFKPLVADANKVETAKAKAASAPMSSRLSVEFFPEGGDLIAGMDNRVYFRIFPANTLPKNLEAVVVVAGAGKQDEIVKLNLPGGDTITAGHQLVGHFTFKPQANQSYRFRVSAAGKELDAFPLPAVRTSGVTLSVPNVMIGSSQPLAVKVHSSQAEPLLVVASCRGQLLDQKIVQTGEKPTDVTLEPLAPGGGVLRVTVYEKAGKDWQPAAERLVYRQPAQSLTVSTNLSEKTLKAGERAHLNIDLRKESGDKSAGWVHALVIDQNAWKAGGMVEPDPIAQFLFGGDMHDPENLEDFLLSTGAVADKTIDLFLGTQGWRRFATRQETETAKLVAGRALAETDGLALFSAGTNVDAMLNQYASAVRAKQAELASDANRQRDELVSQREITAERARAAAESLAEYEQRPMQWLRTGVGVVVALLLVAGTLLLVVGLITVLRQRSSPRLMLVGSFCVLLVGLVLFSATGSLRTANVDNQGQHWLAWLTPGPPAPRWQAGVANKAAPNDARVTSELYAAAAPRDEELKGRDLANSVNLRAAMAMQMQPDLAKPGAAGGGGKGGGGGAGGKKGAKGGGIGGGGINPPAGGFGGAVPPPVPVQPQKDAQSDKVLQTIPQALSKDGKLQESKADLGVLRQFANTVQPGGVLQPQELLLWSPHLFAVDGTAQVTFDLPAKTATYQIIIYGNTADGRLGAYHGQLDAK